MYIFLVGIPVCLIISLVFHFLSLLAGGHIDTSGERTSQGLNGEGGELFQNTGKIANTFDKIQMGIRIMPSQNYEEGMYQMQWTD